MKTYVFDLLDSRRNVLTTDNLTTDYLTTDYLTTDYLTTDYLTTDYPKKVKLIINANSARILFLRLT